MTVMHLHYLYIAAASQNLCSLARQPEQGVTDAAQRGGSGIIGSEHNRNGCRSVHDLLAFQLRMPRSANHQRFVIGNSFRQQSAGESVMGKINGYVAFGEGGIKLLSLIMSRTHASIRILRHRLLNSLAHAARNACNKNGNHITKMLKNIETLKKSGKLSFLLFRQWNQRKTYAGLYISPHRQSRLDRNRIGIQNH